ncbi:unnamed protein product [Hyaloperonospora brassicae]|uniref:RxLR effector candidate protein n=1 Tax=Hyaloperonospora brassicae TaxID=162125 RepID=A0AAV0URN8_HYABA|nr:unnamed protein product [Hyaloperonospora brassicae]
MRFVVSVFAVAVTLAAATISASSSEPLRSSRTSSPVDNALDANAGKETAAERNEQSGVDIKGEERGLLEAVSKVGASFAAKFRSGGGAKPISSVALHAGTKAPTPRRSYLRHLFKTYMGMGGAVTKGAAGGKSVSGFKKWVSSLLRRFRTKKKSAEDGGAAGKVPADKTPDLLPVKEPVPIIKPPKLPGETTTVGDKKKRVTWNDAELVKFPEIPATAKGT